MTPSADTSSLVDRTIRVAATATTLFAILLPNGGEMLPSRYYILNSPFLNPPLHIRYQWERQRDNYLIPESPEEFFEHNNFVSMPPKKVYSVHLRIEKTVKGEPRIVLPEA